MTLILGPMADHARIALLGVPYDAASSFQRGAAEGPAAIRDAFTSSATNGWTESMVDLRAPGMLIDAGDVGVAGTDDDIRARIEAAMAAVMASSNRPIVLGGDHSITYPLIRAVRRRFPRLAILLIDAHGDLYDNFEGNKYSHACPFARIMEERLADRLVQVGIRTMNRHLREQADRFGVEVVTMRDWSDGRVFSFAEPLYVSVDLDGLDPAFAPGVAHREPGGFSTRQVIEIIQRVRATVIGADVVECNPSLDPAGITPWVAAKIVRELAARILDHD
jgi:arginase